MLLWEIRDQCTGARGWIVAWTVADAQDIARREDAELVGTPIEWFPGHGTQVFWDLDYGKQAAMH